MFEEVVKGKHHIGQMARVLVSDFKNQVPKLTVPVIDQGNGQFRGDFGCFYFFSHEGSFVKLNGMQVGSLRCHSNGMDPRLFGRVGQ